MRHLTEKDRYYIEVERKRKTPVKDIAAYKTSLHVCYTPIISLRDDYFKPLSYQKIAEIYHLRKNNLDMARILL